MDEPTTRRTDEDDDVRAARWAVRPPEPRRQRRRRDQGPGPAPAGDGRRRRHRARARTPGHEGPLEASDRRHEVVQEREEGVRRAPGGLTSMEQWLSAR